MELPFQPLEGRFIRLEPFAPELKTQIRSAIGCDPDSWAIMPMNPTCEGFEQFWSTRCGAPMDQLMTNAIRRAAAIKKKAHQLTPVGLSR